MNKPNSRHVMTLEFDVDSLQENPTDNDILKHLVHTVKHLVENKDDIKNVVTLSKSFDIVRKDNGINIMIEREKYLVKGDISETDIGMRFNDITENPCNELYMDHWSSESESPDPKEGLNPPWSLDEEENKDYPSAEDFY